MITAQAKSTGTAYLLWFFLGGLGLHKFYLGRPFMGIFYCCTLGGFFIGVFFDLFTLPGQVEEANRLRFNEAYRANQKWSDSQ